MKILLISQYFFPETGATSNRVYSLAKYFHNQGAEVRVIAEKPNHPKGVFFERYEDGIFLDTFYKEVPVTYTWVKTKPDKGFLDRILFYVSFMFMAVIAAWRTKEKYDVVIASSPPLFVGLAGWIIARFKKAKFVFDVRDLWPDVAVKMGMLNNKFAISIAEKVEQFLYKKADLITAVTTSFKEAIKQKGIKPSKIEIIMNGTEPNVFNPESLSGQLRKHLGLNNNFYVSYVGNIGLAQGLDHIIESAAQMQKRGEKDITFLMIGDGPKKEDLKELALSKKLKNLTFIDRVPLETASRYMNASDALLVPLANDPVYSQFIPSKLFDSMAASKPVLLSVGGESRDIIEKPNAGIYYEAENADRLTEHILWLKNNPKEAEEMGGRGRDYVIKNYTRSVQAERMLGAIQKLV